MSLIEILIIALALSIDAFAVSLAASTAGRVYDRRAAFRLSFHFGLFQFLMPVLGWSLGITLEPYIAAFDHWVAAILLALVASRMIWAGFHPESSAAKEDPSRGLVLVMLSTAVSIDALAVGLSLGVLDIGIWFPSIVIGVVTSAMSVLAILGGRRLSGWLGNSAQFVGGVVLLIIAARILITHLT